MNIEDLTRLRDKCNLFNKFMMNHPDMLNEIIPALEESNDLINDAFAKRRISRLKAMSNDIDDQVLSGVSIKDATNFKALLMDKYGIDYEIIGKARVRKIQNILKRGKISSFDEFELIESRVDPIYSDPDCTEEMEELNKLLLEYEQKGIIKSPNRKLKQAFSS